MQDACHLFPALKQSLGVHNTKDVREMDAVTLWLIACHTTDDREVDTLDCTISHPVENSLRNRLWT